MNIVWFPHAVELAREIASYIELDKPSVAVRWVGNIFDSVSRSIEFLQSGRIVPELGRDEIREIVEGNYCVVYKIAEQEIRLLIVKRYRQKL